MADSSLHMFDYKNPVHDHFPLSLEIDILETYTIHVGWFELGAAVGSIILPGIPLLLADSFFLTIKNIILVSEQSNRAPL